MRIGDLLSTKLSDVRTRERRIEIYEGEKDRRHRHTLFGRINNLCFLMN